MLSLGNKTHFMGNVPTLNVCIILFFIMRIKLNLFEWNYTLNGKSWNKGESESNTQRAMWVYEARECSFFVREGEKESKLACTQNTTLKSIIIYFANLVFAVIFFYILWAPRH